MRYCMKSDQFKPELILDFNISPPFLCNMFSSENTPVTRILVFLNLGIHLALCAYIFISQQGELVVQDFYETYGLLPDRFWKEGFFWQPLSSMFLHGGLQTAIIGTERGIFNSILIFLLFGMLHVGVNMLALWSLGQAIERTIGSIRFAWLYFISGMCGAMAVILITPTLEMATVGASGAVLGVLGALAVFYPNSRLLVFFIPMKARTAAIMFIGISLIFIISDSGGLISHTGHLGGLVGGLLYSKFALGLHLFRENLVSGPAGRVIFRGFNSNSEDEEILKNLNQYTDRDSKTGSINSSLGVTEKEINPLSGPADSSSRIEQDQAESRKKIFYDPATGRFYFK